jgi:hypothetical protein
MATLTVTFANGKTLTRKTDKPYTHAWIAIGGRNVLKGFASTQEKADRAEKNNKAFLKSAGYTEIFSEVKPVDCVQE